MALSIQDRSLVPRNFDEVERDVNAYLTRSREELSFEDPLMVLDPVSFFLPGFRKVSQTIAATPQTKATAPSAGIQKIKPATPRTMSHNPTVAMFIDRRGFSGRSVF